MNQRNLPVLALAVLTQLVAVAACKKSGTTKPGAPAAPAQLPLRSAGLARADLVAQVVAPNLQQAMATAAQMAGRLGLPTSETDLRRALTSGKGVPPFALDKVDLTKPAALVVITEAGPPAVAAGGDAAAAASPGAPTTTTAGTRVVGTLVLRDPSPAGFKSWVASWATVRERDADAVSVWVGSTDGGRLAPDGGARPDQTWSGWLLHRDGAVCIADTKGALTAGCGLALHARNNPGPTSVSGDASEHLKVVLIPEGMARAQGTTLAEAAARMKATLVQSNAGPMAGAPNARLMQGWLGGIVDRAVELGELRLGLSLDLAKGLGVGVAGFPRAGSALASKIAGRVPFALDPAVLTGPTPAALMAMGSCSWCWDMFAMMLPPADEPAAAGTRPAARKGTPDRAALDAAVTRIKEALAGPVSARVRFSEGTRPELRYDVVYPLKDGLDAKQSDELLGAWQTLAGSDWLVQAMAEQARSSGVPAMKMKVTSRRQGAIVITRVVVDPRSIPPEAQSLRGFPMFDGRPFETKTTIEGNRLVLTTGTDTKGGLEALRQVASAPTPTGSLAAALAEAQGEDGFYFMDLAPSIRAVILGMESGMRAGAGRSGALSPALAMSKQASGLLANVELGMWASHRGGDALTVRWRLPTSTLDAAASVVRQAMGMMGGMMGGGTAPPP